MGWDPIGDLKKAVKNVGDEVSKKTGIGNGRGPKIQPELPNVKLDFGFDAPSPGDILNDISKKTGIGNGRGPVNIDLGLQDELNDFYSNPIEGIINSAIQGITGGILGVEDGKIDRGWLFRGVDEAFGEITGRNMARKQMQESQKLLAEQKKEAENQRKWNLQRQESQERQLSGMASSRSRGGIGGSGNGGGSLSGVESQMATDFLGL